ncbi:MAG TPA: hypothetical protein VFX51_12965 [Solirubrobacteraceae bacterium]|nr:hypothetical protein [Solirubrobacteraceae bacterium]
MTVSVEEVGRIAGLRDPVIRNLQITECYARLAAGVVSGGANWCTFATWASKQAGCTIRGEDLDAAVRRSLGDGFELLHPIRSFWRALLRHGLLNRESRFGRFVWKLHTPFDAIELASDAVARGNRKVFEEIGLEFARYLTLDFATFMDGLRDEDLRQAFTHLEAGRAGGERELIVLANLEIGLHEQTRLQPEIREALDAATAPSQSLVVKVFGWPLQRQLTKLSREVITGSFMVLTLPGIALSLSHHLDIALVAPSNPELLTLVTRYEPVPPAVDNCGAHDWSDLHQRMHYISHLFRAYDTHPALADPPFTPAQVKLIQAGRLPDGAL